MASALSGRKYSPSRTRNLFPDQYNLDTMDNATAQIINIGIPRSVGRKYQPVRISTMFSDNPPGSINPSSSRKTMGRSAQKMPIRNLHKLLESPKRNARKRLDSLYDCSKPKKNMIPTTVGKVQASSAKKPVQKPAAPAAASETKKSVNPKAGPSKQTGTENKRQSRLLPPGTITGSYVDRRSSLAPRNSFYKPLNSRFTLNVKKSGSKRPSDVPEESPQALETSNDSAEEPGKLPGLSLANQIEKTKEINSKDDKAAAPLCNRCSRLLDESVNTNSADASDKVIDKAGDNPEPQLQDENERNEALQRPTVIVTRATEDYHESAQGAVQDGSYSEILSLQQQNQSRSVKADESLLFKQTESALTRLDGAGESNGDKTTEFVFEMISSSKQMLVRHKNSLEISISQQEEQLKSLRLMLGHVNEQLERQKTLETDMKPNGLGELDKEKLALLVAQGVENKSPNILKENLEANKPEGAKPKRGRKSRSETRSKDIEDPESKQEDEMLENIENEAPQRRRSARLAMKQGDISLPVQQSTPVTGKKKAKESMAKSKPCTPSLNTPARNGKWGRRSERPLREYMVLKSAIKFLNTPDSRRYQIGSDEKVKVRGSIDQADQEAQLTDKLLEELHELYSTP